MNTLLKYGIKIQTNVALGPFLNNFSKKKSNINIEFGAPMD